MSATVSQIKRGLAILLVAAALLSSAPTVRANPTVYHNTLLGTGWILIPLDNNKFDWGSCWVLDRQQKLIVTNYHVVKENTDVRVRFPYWINNELQVDAHFYWHKVNYHQGKVVFRDKTRDLALVQLETMPDYIRQLPLAAKSALMGETVHSIGNSSVNYKIIDAGSLWRYTRGEVRLVRRHSITIKVGNEQITIQGRILETSSPINPGDSGGPVVNDRGELVGVVSSFDTTARNVSWNIDVQEVRAFWQAYQTSKEVVARTK